MDEVSINMADQAAVVMLITFGILVVPLVFIALDFWAGIRKAKQRGEEITSDGWQRTVQKIAKYYNMLLAMLVIDAMQVVGLWYLNNYSEWDMPLFPWFVFLGVLFIGAIEVKSIIEPANDKEKRDMRKVLQLAGEIASHRADPDGIARAVVKYLEANEQKPKPKKKPRPRTGTRRKEARS